MKIAAKTKTGNDTLGQRILCGSELDALTLAERVIYWTGRRAWWKARDPDVYGLHTISRGVANAERGIALACEQMDKTEGD